MSDWLPRHSSTKYAVYREATGYSIVAVHGVHPTATGFLGSVQVPLGEAHGYRAPALLYADRIVFMAQTTEAAWKFKRHIQEQDREAEEANR